MNTRSNERFLLINDAQMIFINLVFYRIVAFSAVIIKVEAACSDFSFIIIPAADTFVAKALIVSIQPLFLYKFLRRISRIGTDDF